MSVKAYVGKTRSRSLMARLDQLGIGECTVRGELSPQRESCGWFYDNGAFRDFQAGRPFDALRFTRDMWAIANGGRRERRFSAPDFIVLPDLVAAGAASLAFSRSWKGDPLVRWAAPLYLAVQDGMEEAQVAAELEGIAGIFVGGSLEWKLATGKAWAAFAHARGLRCHIGRVGTAQRVAWARDAGADSIDSCLPLWSTSNLDVFAEALS